MVQGEKIKLRALERSDLESAKNWVNDREIAAMVLRSLPVTMFEEEKWYEQVLQDKTKVVFAVEWMENNTYVGNAGFYHIDWMNRKAEFWIIVGNKDYWGKGIGKEATQLMIQYGFESLNLNKIYLNVDANHTPAIKVYEKAGFAREGVLQQEAYIQGRYVDVLRMAIFRKGNR